MSDPFKGFVTFSGGEVAPLEAWKDDPVDSARIDKFTNLELKVDKGSRTVTTVISDGKKDRDNDVIDVDGWNLKEYKKNPVVLWAHDSSSLPIAKSTVRRSDGRLVSKDTFPEEGEYPFADSVFNLVKGGFINAKSVGFVPDEWVFDEKAGGFHFSKTTLLEHSYVPIPANPRALIIARSKGIDIGPVVDWAEATLASSGRLADYFKDENGLYWPNVADNSTSTTFDFGNLEVKVKDDDKNVDETVEEKAEDIKAEPPVSVYSDETENYLERVRALKRTTLQLEEEGFNEGEIKVIMSRVKELEGIEEKEEKAVDDEPRFDLDTDELREALAEQIGGIKDSLVEVTGRVHN